MIEPILIIVLLSSMTGIYLLGMITAIYLRSNTLLLKDYGLFILSFQFFMIGELLDQISAHSSNREFWILTSLIWLIRAVGGILYIGASPFFFFRLLNFQINNILKTSLILIDLLAVCASLLYLFFPRFYGAVHILSILMFGTLFWELAFIFVNLLNMKDKILKKAVLVLLIITVFFTPLMLFDYFISVIPALYSLAILDDLSRPIYFLIISILSIYFTMIYFNRPGYRKGGILTEYFLKNIILPKENGKSLNSCLKGKIIVQ